MNEVKYPAIVPAFVEGSTKLRGADGCAVATVGEFWRWAFSDLIGNTERGALAEFFVACAIGVQNQPRIMWDSYDLRTPEGIAVEVKASGYIQTWGQRELSKISFGIRPTASWDANENLFGSTMKRQADIYVFCVHKHKEQETVDPTDLCQWDFYLLPTEVLNQKVGSQKSISLSALLKLGAEKCPFSDIHKRTIELCAPVFPSKEERS